jgi:branched-chain amino acid transport system substrate-binding protein
VDCVVFTGGLQDATVATLAAVGRALPRAQLYVSQRLAYANLTERGRSGIRATVAARVSLTLPAAASLRSAAGRRFAAAFTRRFRDAPGLFAVYGYEAMRLAINAIRRARSSRRADVIAALRATKDRRSVLGRYSIDRNGDTTSTTFGRFAVRGGRLRFVTTIDSRR